MNKSDVVGAVAEASDVSRQQAETVIESFLSTVKSAVHGGDRISWPGFGSFSSSKRKARTGRNPATGASMKIPASTVFRFSPSGALKEFMNKSRSAAKASSKAAPKRTGPAKKAASKAAPAKKTTTKKR